MKRMLLGCEKYTCFFFIANKNAKPLHANENKSD